MGISVHFSSCGSRSDLWATSFSEAESEPEDIEASLRREVAEMKQKREQKEMRFEAVSSGAKNVIFIRTKVVWLRPGFYLLEQQHTE